MWLDEIKFNNSPNDINFRTKLEKIFVPDFVKKILFFDENIDCFLPLKDKEWNRCRVKKEWVLDKKLIIYRYDDESKREKPKWYLRYRKFKIDWITIYKILEFETINKWWWLWKLLLTEFHKMIGESPSFLQDTRDFNYKTEDWIYEKNWYRQIDEINNYLVRWNIDSNSIKEFENRIF